MITVKNLVKRYGGNVALDGVSFTVDSGEIVGLLGPNGAGKSTAMNILTGFLSLTSGEVEIDGLNILSEPLEVKKRIGYLPEQPPLYLDMTVDEFLNFVYDLKGTDYPRDAHLSEILEAVKLTDVRKRLIRNLSKGYRQRVGIAEALVGNPPILIFDEPTVGLDPKQIIEIRNLLRTLGKKHTVILSTHILSEVQAICERILVIDKGRLIADARTDEITRTIDGQNRLTVRIVSPQRATVLSELRALPGVRNVTASEMREGDSFLYTVESEAGLDIRKPIFNLCARLGTPLVGMEKEETPLEEIFLRLVDAGGDAASFKKNRKGQKKR